MLRRLHDLSIIKHDHDDVRNCLRFMLQCACVMMMMGNKGERRGSSSSSKQAREACSSFRSISLSLSLSLTAFSASSSSCLLPSLSSYQAVQMAFGVVQGVYMYNCCQNETFYSLTQATYVGFSRVHTLLTLHTLSLESPHTT